MSSAASNLVNKVWNYCNLLRDDGVSYGDYVEQLTYLLFLKMDYERTRPPYNKKSTIPEDYNWASLIELDGLPLERHYRNTLENLGKEPGILGIIFRKAQNKIQNPAHLRRLIVDLIDKEPWSALSADSQRRYLRRPARKKRPRYEIRRRSVLHAARPDRRHRRGHASAAGNRHHRSRRRYRWLPAFGRQPHPQGLQARS